MVKTALEDTYLRGTTPKSLKNEASKFWKMYYDRETRVMVYQSVNEFYTWSLFKNNVLPHDVAFPLKISATFFKNRVPILESS